MVLDFGSFTTRGLMVDRVCPTDTWEGAWGQSTERVGCKSRNEAEEDRKNINLSVMAK